MHKKIIFLCQIVAVISKSLNFDSDESYDYPDKYFSAENVTSNPYDEKNCTKMKQRCESCTELVMCIDTEYGYKKQYLPCPSNSTCLVDKCTSDKNPLCDGTADLPFICHVPGVFPDPFDCQKYHFCVPLSNEMVNGSLNLTHFQHTCQEDEGVEYKFDPKSGYCKFEIENGCSTWPVPLCKVVGSTGALIENKSIFFVCDLVQGHLYPHLYVCPHGEEYNEGTMKCIKYHDEPRYDHNGRRYDHYG